ncbi:Isoamylase 1, chloroplastic [Coccomyxa sp. Obi]|nr:Isoamylase 1, chloroplastic [Coccomyxa sp. Obi]
MNWRICFGSPAKIRAIELNVEPLNACSRSHYRRCVPFVHSATSSSATVTAPPPKKVATRPLPAPAKRQLGPNKSSWSAPSGQPGGSSFNAPLRGKPEPMGATVTDGQDTMNFAIFASSATSVSLVLFTEKDLQAGRTTHEIKLSPQLNSTGGVWHIMLPKLDTSLLYGFRVGGRHQDVDVDAPEAAGHRYDEGAVLLDPYATAIIGRRVFGQLGPDVKYGAGGALGLARTWPQAAGVLPTPGTAFDWEGDQPLNLPLEDLVIYEMHVRGFTWDPSSSVSSPGTYAGMTERLDYLTTLGINAIELQPIHEFNELEYYQIIPGTDEYRYNYWGYSTVGFFAPMARYSAAAAAGRPGMDIVNEFKTLVKECHRRGIEVILDVVFNHTAEGNENGPSISFRGLDNRVYYMLAPEGQYYNYSGCGNTFNCNHPVVRKFVLDALRYWVVEMHVDGFRFDLGSIMTRAHSLWHPSLPGDDDALTPQGIIPDGSGVPTGTPLSEPPLVEMISEDPVLRNTKLIAEAWDCDGLFQVGAFPHYGGRWAEWNGNFRDTVRQFIKGTEGPFASAFASSVCGSPSIYASAEPGEGDWWGNNGGRQWRGGRGPQHSINFITAHDGFTLADLVAFNEKHNQRNGEGNRDGENHNLSWNCGVEGDTRKPSVLRLRARQMRNLAAALLLSHGTPMILMGDEYGHSKGGNNNTYCHDSPLNWFNWTQAAADPTGYARYFRHMVHFRRTHAELRRSSFVHAGAITWHGKVPNEPDWTEESRLVAYTLSNSTGGGLYIAFNTSHKPQVVQLPSWPNRTWQLISDSGQVAPFDFLVADEVLSKEEVAAARNKVSMWLADGMYAMLPYSSLLLESVPDLDTLPTSRRATSFSTAAPTAAARTNGKASSTAPPQAAASAQTPRGSEVRTSGPSTATVPSPAVSSTPSAAESTAVSVLSDAKALAAKITGSQAPPAATPSM